MRLDTARLGQLLTFAGVIITAGAGFVTLAIQGGQAQRRTQCEIARDILQDETPTPYLDIAGRKRLAGAAIDEVERCFKE